MPNELALMVTTLMSKRALSVLLFGLLLCLLPTFCAWAQAQIGGRALVSLEGTVRRLAEKDMLVQTASARVLRFRLPARTEFLGKDGKPIRDSLIRLGDRIRVEVNSGDLETAVYVFFLMAGSTVELEAASTPIEDSAVTAPEPSDFAAAQPSASVKNTDGPSQQPANLPKTENATGNSKINPVDRQPYLWVPPGTFMMGCSENDKECGPDEVPRARHVITNGFWLGRTEVTQEAYRLVMHANPSTHQGDHFPAENMTWDDASSYCSAVDGRLPTEAEWEYAARAGTTTARYGDVDAIAWHSGDSGAGAPTHEVALKQPNGFGLYDMLGNVWEWVSDDPGGGQRIIKGGASGMLPRASRASTRNPIPATDPKGVRRGFRCIWRGE